MKYYQLTYRCRDTSKQEIIRIERSGDGDFQYTIMASKYAHDNAWSECTLYGPPDHRYDCAYDRSELRDIASEWKFVHLNDNELVEFYIMQGMF